MLLVVQRARKDFFFPSHALERPGWPSTESFSSRAGIRRSTFASFSVSHSSCIFVCLAFFLCLLPHCVCNSRVLERPRWRSAKSSSSRAGIRRSKSVFPGRISGNERADRLASTADITSGLKLGRAEVLRGLRNLLDTDRPEHHSIDRLKERGVEKGSG